MYPALLGKITVPENTPDWVVKMVYTPEPPIVSPGALNPWQQERQREVWLAEESAWKKILPLQAKYRTITRLIRNLILEIQDNLRRLENLTGKKSGLTDAAGYATLLYSVSGGPYAWAGTIAKFGIDLVLGIFKKKKAKKIQRRLEELAAQVTVRQSQLMSVEKDVTALIAQAEGIRAGQPAKQTADVQQSEAAYLQRQQLDRTRADVLREKAIQTAQLPRYVPGGRNYATI